MAEQLGSDIENLIWDLDGTLLDSLGVLEDGLAEVLPAYNRLVPARDVLAANFHGSLEDSIGSALGGVEAPELMAIVGDFLRVQDTYYDVVENHLFADAVDLSRRAHAAGKRQILVTNRAHEGRLQASPRSIVAHSALQDYIDVVICGDDSQHRKPNPQVLGNLAAELDPDKTVVIGDQFVDIELAHKLGSRAVIVSRNGEPPKHLDALGYDWRSVASIVTSLDDVKV